VEEVKSLLFGSASSQLKAIFSEHDQSRRVVLVNEIGCLTTVAGRVIFASRISHILQANFPSSGLLLHS
jgi:hypothetical protein